MQEICRKCRKLKAEKCRNCKSRICRNQKNAEKQNRKIAESGMQETRNLQKNEEIAGTEKINAETATAESAGTRKICRK